MTMIPAAAGGAILQAFCKGGNRMRYYPIVDLASMEPEDSGGGYKTKFTTLGGEVGAILPVFIAVNRFWAFAEDYLTGDDSIQPCTFPIDPFRLAEKIEPAIETGELGLLVFNPTAVSLGQWSIERERTHPYSVLLPLRARDPPGNTTGGSRI